MSIETRSSGHEQWMRLIPLGAHDPARIGNGWSLYAGLRHRVTASVTRVCIRSARKGSVWVPIGWIMEGKKKGTRKRNEDR